MSNMVWTRFAEDTMRGVEKRGRKTWRMTPLPKRGLGPPRTVRFPTPLRCQCSVLPVQSSTTEQTRSSFGGVQKLSGPLVRFPPPIRFAPPPYHGPNFKDDLAFSKKHFPFAKKMWEIMLRLDGPTSVVLRWFWSLPSKDTQAKCCALACASGRPLRLCPLPLPSQTFVLSGTTFCGRDSRVPKPDFGVASRPKYLASAAALANQTKVRAKAKSSWISPSFVNSGVFP